MGAETGRPTGASDPMNLELVTFTIPPRRIGRRLWSGHSVVARALHVAYQQKLHVSGRISPTIGAMRRGTGGIYGGGGTIDSSNEAVATIVYVDEAGVENTAEVPSGVSIREGAVFRMDHLDGRMFAVRNMSGNRETRWVLGPADFIPPPYMGKRDVILTLLTMLALTAGNWSFVALFAARPTWTVWRFILIRHRWREVRDYMNAITSPAKDPPSWN